MTALNIAAQCGDWKLIVGDQKWRRGGEILCFVEAAYSFVVLSMNKGGPGARRPKPGPRGERLLVLPMMSLIS